MLVYKNYTRIELLITKAMFVVRKNYTYTINWSVMESRNYNHYKQTDPVVLNRKR